MESRTYSYKIKAFKNSGTESEFSASDEGNRLPSNDELMYDAIFPEYNLFLNRNFCCNSNPFLDESMHFEGDTMGTGRFCFEGGTSPPIFHTSHNNYQNLLLIFNGESRGIVNTQGYGWHVGTIQFSGELSSEMDYRIYNVKKWPAYGIYTLRYIHIKV